MSLPHETEHDDQELERYVLGLLPDEAAERLDEASIADDDVVARLRVVETEVIDNYVRGKLAGERLKRFESYYLASPRRRQGVRLAASFIRAVDRPVARANDVRWKDRVVRPTRLTWMVSAAALAILACGVSLFEFVRPRNELNLAQSEPVAADRRTQEPEQQFAGERAAGAAPVEESERERSSAADSASTVPAPGSPDGTRAAPQGTIVAVVLLAPTRAVAPIPTLAIPAATDRVRFELRLESNDFPRYRVELKDPATNNILWRSGWIPPTSSADQGSVSVVVPANLLDPQHYSLDLAGRGTGGSAEVIGSYTVRIAQP